MSMNIRDTVKCGVSLVIPQIAGAVGSLFTMPAIAGWYASLVKPELAPPNWVFAPVWTTIFFLMGWALFLIWRENTSRTEVQFALGMFGIQLALNVCWSFLFFGTQDPRAAFFEITALWLAIAATIVAFAYVSRVAAWLLVPYIAWVSFAAYLNYSIWMLN